MKRFGSLFCQITSAENLLLAHHHTRKAKAYEMEIIMVEEDA